MKTIKWAVLCCGLLLFFESPLLAQTKSPHYKAALELVNSMGLEANFKSTLEAAVSVQARSFPEEQRVNFAQAMLEFMDKFATWEKMKEKYIALYQEEFTESELIELTAFYKSPIGIKYIERAPALTSKGILLGQKLMTDNQGELQAILKKYFGN